MICKLLFVILIFRLQSYILWIITNTNGGVKAVGLRYTTTLEEVTGIVKWFDPAKGIGFIVSEGSKDDILLHANVLRNYG